MRPAQKPTVGSTVSLSVTLQSPSVHGGVHAMRKWSSSPNSQNATQTFGSAPLNINLSLWQNLAHDEAGAPGKGNIGELPRSDSGIRWRGRHLKSLDKVGVASGIWWEHVNYESKGNMKGKTASYFLEEGSCADIRRKTSASRGETCISGSKVVGQGATRR